MPPPNTTATRSLALAFLKRFAPAVLCLAWAADTFAQRDVQLQGGSPVLRKYMRPTWVSMMTPPDSPAEQLVCDGFAKHIVNGKVDEHGMGPRYVSWDTTGTATPEVRERVMLQAIAPHTDDVVGRWFNRDSAGAMDTQVILSRGAYSETDLEWVINNLSTVDRSGAQGWKLLDLTFIAVYNIKSVTPYYFQVPNSGSLGQAVNLAASLNAASQGKATAGAELEGWTVSYTVDLFRLNWSDSTEWQFVQQYWNDRTKPDATKAAAWADAVFPIRKVPVTSYNRSDIVWRQKGLSQEPVEVLLINEVPRVMTEKAVDHFSKNLRELRPRSGVVSDYPIMAKMGDKEGLRVNDRFLAYEYKLTKRKGMVMRRKGVFRVQKVARNKKVTTGSSPTSTFQQQGGKKVERGMTLEEAHDMGMNLSLGYRHLDELSTGGVVMLKTNILGKLLKIPNLYLGGHGTWHIGNDIGSTTSAMRQMRSRSVSTTTAAEPWGGVGHEYGLTLSKERYRGKRGNWYTEMAFSYSWATFNITRYGDDRLFGWLSSSDTKSDFQYKTTLFTFSYGICRHFGPRVAFELRPMVSYRDAFEYRKGDRGYAGGSGSFGTTITPSILAGLKFRF